MALPSIPSLKLDLDFGAGQSLDLNFDDPSCLGPSGTDGGDISNGHALNNDRNRTDARNMTPPILRVGIPQLQQPQPPSKSSLLETTIGQEEGLKKTARVTSNEHRGDGYSDAQDPKASSKISAYRKRTQSVDRQLAPPQQARKQEPHHLSRQNQHQAAAGQQHHQKMRFYRASVSSAVPQPQASSVKNDADQWMTFRPERKPQPLPKDDDRKAQPKTAAIKTKTSKTTKVTMAPMTTETQKPSRLRSSPQQEQPDHHNPSAQRLPASFSYQTLDAGRRFMDHTFRRRAHSSSQSYFDHPSEPSHESHIRERRVKILAPDQSASLPALPINYIDQPMVSQPKDSGRFKRVFGRTTFHGRHLSPVRDSPDQHKWSAGSSIARLGDLFSHARTRSRTTPLHDPLDNHDPTLPHNPADIADVVAPIPAPAPSLNSSAPIPPVTSSLPPSMGMPRPNSPISHSMYHRTSTLASSGSIPASHSPSLRGRSLDGPDRMELKPSTTTTATNTTGSNADPNFLNPPAAPALVSSPPSIPTAPVLNVTPSPPVASSSMDFQPPHSGLTPPQKPVVPVSNSIAPHPARSSPVNSPFPSLPQPPQPVQASQQIQETERVIPEAFGMTSISGQGQEMPSLSSVNSSSQTMATDVIAGPGGPGPSRVASLMTDNQSGSPIPSSTIPVGTSETSNSAAGVPVDSNSVKLPPAATSSVSPTPGQPDGPQPPQAAQLNRRSRSPISHLPEPDRLPAVVIDGTDPTTLTGTLKDMVHSASQTESQQRPWAQTPPEQSIQADGLSNKDQAQQSEGLARAFVSDGSGEHDPHQKDANTNAPVSVPAALPDEVGHVDERQQTPPQTQRSTPLRPQQQQDDDKEVVIPADPRPLEPVAVVTDGPVELPADIPSDNSSEEIVMSSTAYPGQEWAPSAMWDGRLDAEY